MYAKLCDLGFAFELIDHWKNDVDVVINSPTYSGGGSFVKFTRHASECGIDAGWVTASQLQYECQSFVGLLGQSFDFSLYGYGFGF